MVCSKILMDALHNSCMLWICLVLNLFKPIQTKIMMCPFHSKFQSLNRFPRRSCKLDCLWKKLCCPQSLNDAHVDPPRILMIIPPTPSAPNTRKVRFLAASAAGLSLFLLVTGLPLPSLHSACVLQTCECVCSCYRQTCKEKFLCGCYYCCWTLFSFHDLSFYSCSLVICIIIHINMKPKGISLFRCHFFLELCIT